MACRDGPLILICLLGLLNLYEMSYCEMAPLDTGLDRFATPFASYLVARFRSNSTAFLLLDWMVPCVIRLEFPPARESVERNEELKPAAVAHGLLPVWLRLRDERSLRAREFWSSKGVNVMSLSYN